MSEQITVASEHTLQNPLDLLEGVLSNLNWLFERRSDDEVAAEAPGQWSHYGLFFSWSSELNALYFSCSPDFKAPSNKLNQIYELVCRINERLWMGYFSLENHDNTLLFRHTLLLHGLHTFSVKNAEEMINLALKAWEEYFPAFQFVIWGGKTPLQALESCMFDCQGEA
ncbi:type III secretion system chaperone family protein [Entomobacter blattae]|uniref:Bacterial sensory transduction regulator n=1 Tax=Entomobacter blattae TaxID=2762277 RepID=A0A7H1NQ85_9PROT|nr:YbjN domain-containing protein [Entomobacter blattae]QNT77945.1 Putative bacterial sensory transduction regulator [Entomobacter blattae]